MAKTKQNRVGIEFITNEGYKLKVIEYISNVKVKVKFLDEYGYEMWTTWQSLKNGHVRNPFYKSIYDVAYLGLHSNGEKPITSIKRKATREYNLWRSMLERCYSEKYETYKNIYVCDRWLCYANFLEDLPFIENYDLWINNHEYNLDKDVKQPNVNNKVYSLETCCFITKAENTKEMVDRVKPYERYGTKIKAINIETEETYSFNSINECARELNLWVSNIVKCLNGEQTSHKGYKFELEN